MFTTKQRFAFVASLLVGSILGLSSCYENKIATNLTPAPAAAQKPIQLTATINGAQEKPTPVITAATGTFTGTIDPASRVLSYTVAYSGITPVAGHLHRITLPNGNGPNLINFASLASPIIGTTSTLAQSRVDSMVAGQWYVNLHTAANPAGEIRGDIRVK